MVNATRILRDTVANVTMSMRELIVINVRKKDVLLTIDITLRTNISLSEIHVLSEMYI